MEDGVWRTIKGRRVFIKNGKNLKDAIKESGKFNNKTEIKEEKKEIKEDLKEDNFKNETEKKEAKENYDALDKLEKEKDNEEETKKMSRNEYKNKQAEESGDEQLIKDRTQEPTEDTYTRDLEGKHISQPEATKEYTSNFNLEAEVNDFDAAQQYLSSDDMAQYLPDELKDVVTSVDWTLDDEASGHVSVKTTRDLTDGEKDALEDWIEGQNYDGLGEGFEQQKFAETYYNPYTGDGPYTYNEAEQEISDLFDNMDPQEYSDYLDETTVEDAIDSFMSEAGYEDADEDTINNKREEVREEILSNPEDYLDWETIDKAKYEAIGPDVSNIDNWYNMSSIRSNGKGFEEKDLKPTKEKSETQKKLEKDMGEELVEHTNDQGKKWYSSKSLDDEEEQFKKGIEQNKKNDDDYEYNIYKKSKENPDSIDPMTEWSTDWEALDEKYRDRYKKERDDYESRVYGSDVREADKEMKRVFGDDFKYAEELEAENKTNSDSKVMSQKEYDKLMRESGMYDKHKGENINYDSYVQATKDNGVEEVNKSIRDEIAEENKRAEKQRQFDKETEELYGKEYTEAKKRKDKEWEKHNDVAQMEKEFAEAQKSLSNKTNNEYQKLTGAEEDGLAGLYGKKYDSPEDLASAVQMERNNRIGDFEAELDRMEEEGQNVSMYKEKGWDDEVDYNKLLEKIKNNPSQFERYLNNQPTNKETKSNRVVTEIDNGSVYAKPGRKWEVLEEDTSAYGDKIYKVKDENGDVKWKPAKDFETNNNTKSTKLDINQMYIKNSEGKVEKLDMSMVNKIEDAGNRYEIDMKDGSATIPKDRVVSINGKELEASKNKTEVKDVDVSEKSGDWIKDAYKKYLKEHPKSKISLSDFMKKNK